MLFGPGTGFFWTPEHCFSIPMNRKEKQNMFSFPPPPPDSPVLPQQPQEIVCFPSIPPLVICLQPPLPGTVVFDLGTLLPHPYEPPKLENMFSLPPPLQEWSCRFNSFSPPARGRLLGQRKPPCPGQTAQVGGCKQTATGCAPPQPPRFFL